MNQNAYPYPADEEWEGLHSPYMLTTFEVDAPLPPGSQRISLWRDESYKIRGKLSGIVTGPYTRTNPIPGSTIPSVTIIGTDKVPGVNFIDDPAFEDVNPYFNYDLPNCHILNRHESWQADEPGTFYHDLNIWRVRKGAPRPSEVVRHTEWYLNGPDLEVIFPRSLERIVDKTYRKTLGNDNEGAYPSFPLGSRAIRGYARIEYGTRQFIIFSVPQEYGPAWSKKLGIEYRPEWGGIPDEDEREAIGEIVSFVLGRRLLPIGYTAFNASGQRVEQVSVNPWGDNVVAICGWSSDMPIRLSRLPFDRAIETVLQQLLPAYLEKRSELNLRDAIWRYWLAREAAIGADLPLLAAAVEGIGAAWLDSNKSRSSGVYIPAKTYRQLLKDELASIRKKLQGVDNSRPVLNSIEYAYNMSSGRARRIAFFDEINLKTGPVEEQAITGRHGMAHGAATDEQHDQKLRQDRRVYVTLFERVLLKVLGYQGTYIDRSTLGFSDRPIDEPQGTTDEERTNLYVTSIDVNGVWREVSRREH